MKPEETIDFHIRWAWSKISKHYNAEAAKFGGTMAIGYALLNIDKKGTLSTSLGPKMGMEATSLSRTLKKMEDDGLIRREKDKEDKRKVHIFLTKTGEEMRDRSRKTVLKFNKTIQNATSKKERESFIRVMNQINGALDSSNGLISK
jgi:DNA-binding MarR family transcriptional regulator